MPKRIDIDPANGWAPRGWRLMLLLRGGPGGGAGRGTAKTASIRASFRAIHGAQRPRPAPPPDPRQVPVAASHGRKIKKGVRVLSLRERTLTPFSTSFFLFPHHPPTMGRRYHGPRVHGAHGPVRRWGGVGSRERSSAWMRMASLQGWIHGDSREPIPPRQHTAIQPLPLPLQLLENKQGAGAQPRQPQPTLYSDSKIPAAPMPVPMHIVTMPYFCWRRRRPCSRVAVRIAPVAPSG